MTVLHDLEICFGLPQVDVDWLFYFVTFALAWQLNIDLLGDDCKKFLDQLSDISVKELNLKILACTFHALLKGLIVLAPAHSSSVGYITILSITSFCCDH